MKKAFVVFLAFVATFIVCATKDQASAGLGIHVGVAAAEAGGKCLPDGAKCAGSQLQCCNKPCTNGVCSN